MAYAFIAMVPIVLILALVLVSAYGLTGQIAVYLINSELDRRTGILRGSTATILETPAERRPEVIVRTQDFAQRFFPATAILVSDGGEYRYPASASIEAPPAGWKDANGIVVKDGQPYSWAHAVSGHTEVTIMAPLSQDYLSNRRYRAGESRFSDTAHALRSPAAGAAGFPRNNLLDLQVNWGSLVPVTSWSAPGNRTAKACFWFTPACPRSSVHSSERISASATWPTVKSFGARF